MRLPEAPSILLNRKRGYFHDAASEVTDHGSFCGGHEAMIADEIDLCVQPFSPGGGIMLPVADARSYTIDAGTEDLADLPEITMFGDARHRSAEQLLVPHRNPGIEICLCRAGIYRWDVEGSVVEIRPGELSITRPWQLHSGQNNVLGPGRLSWIIVTAGGAGSLHAPALEPLLGEEAPAIFDVISNSRRAFIGSVSGVPEIFDFIGREICARDPGRIAAIRSGLIRLLILVGRRLADLDEQGSREDEPIPPAVVAVLSEVAGAPERAWTSAGMAERAGLGATAFTDWCRRATGRSPRWYLLEQRLRSARELLLASDWTVTEIALQTGFSSSQHFSAAFRKLFGETPSACRRRLAQVVDDPSSGRPTSTEL